MRESLDIEKKLTSEIGIIKNACGFFERKEKYPYHRLKNLQ